MHSFLIWVYSANCNGTLNIIIRHFIACTYIPNYMFRSRFRDLGLPLKIGRQLRMLAKICVHVLIRRRLLVMPWSSRRRRYSISGRSRSWPLMIGILCKARGKNMQNCIRLSYASELAAASKWMHTLPIHFHSVKCGKNV